MKVKDILNKKTLIVHPDTTIKEIEKIFKRTKIWTIYIGTPDNFVGVISPNDLRNRGRDKSSTTPVSSIMSSGVFSIDENSDVEDALRILSNKRINDIAVTRNGKHVGIISRNDIETKQSKTSSSTSRPTFSSILSDLWLIFSNLGKLLLYIGLLIFGMFIVAIIFNPSILALYFNSIQGQPEISTIYLSDVSLTELNSKFNSENMEFRYCLFGKPYQNGMLITSMNEPKYHFQSTTSITAEDCPYNSIGFIHSHPLREGNCLLSSDDIATFNSRPFPIMGVICENNRITIYKKENTNIFIPIYVVSSNSDSATNLRDITPQTACVGERFCLGTCWGGCDDAYHVWHCTPNGGLCETDPKNCPPDAPNSCLGKCYTRCAKGGVFLCTPNGGNCQY